MLNRITIERDGLKVSIEVNEVSLNDVLEAVEDALRGLGFVLRGELVDYSDMDEREDGFTRND